MDVEFKHGRSSWRQHNARKYEDKAMLELLLYCHMFAKLRYAAEIAAVTDAVTDFFGRTKVRQRVRQGVRHAQWLAPGARRRDVAFGFWTEQSLDRLDAYVRSAA
jgi:hypothetical protein